MLLTVHFAVDGREQNSREQLKAIAELRAQRLYAHAPKLRELGGSSHGKQYDQHLAHVFAELAARRYSPSAEQQALLRERLKQCTLCRALE
jgi:hypothetical protein